MRRCMLIAIMLTALLFCGCDDRVELDELGIVSALGIDLADEPGYYDITVQMIRPSEAGSAQTGGGGAGRPFLVVSSTGETLFDAIRKATAISSRKLFFAHDRVLVIGSELAKNGVGSVLDLLFRDKEVRPTMQVLVARGKAKDIIYSVSEFEAVPGIGLAQLLAVVEAATSGIGEMTLHEFQSSLISSPGVEPVVPLVDGLTAATIGDQRSPAGSRVSAQASEKERILQLVGSAVFREDRMVDALDLTESRGYRWVVNQVQSGILVVRWPETGEKVDMEIVTTETKVEVKADDGAPSVTVKVDVSARIGAQEGRADLTSLVALKQLQVLVQETVKHEISLTMQKAADLGTDIFGFGDALRGKDSELWDKLRPNWSKTIRELPVDITVEAHVRRYGLTNTPSTPTGK